MNWKSGNLLIEDVKLKTFSKADAKLPYTEPIYELVPTHSSGVEERIEERISESIDEFNRQADAHDIRGRITPYRRNPGNHSCDFIIYNVQNEILARTQIIMGLGRQGWGSPSFEIPVIRSGMAHHFELIDRGTLPPSLSRRGTVGTSRASLNMRSINVTTGMILTVTNFEFRLG